MNILVNNKKVGFTNDFISSAKEIQTLIETFHHARICEGCAFSNSVRNFETSFAFKDYLGTLRHNDCLFILENSFSKKNKYCEKCRKVKITLANKTMRLQKRKSLQRIVLKWSSNKGRKAGLLQKKLNFTMRQKVRTAGQLQLLKSKFQNLREKMTSINKAFKKTERTQSRKK